MSLTALQILSCDDTPLKEVPVKEWGGSVYIRTLRASETERALSILQAGAAEHTRLVGLLCCDADGQPLFSQEQVEALNQKSMSAIQTIMRAIVEYHPVLSADTASIEGN